MKWENFPLESDKDEKIDFEEEESECSQKKTKKASWGAISRESVHGGMAKQNVLTILMKRDDIELSLQEKYAQNLERQKQVQEVSRNINSVKFRDYN